MKRSLRPHRRRRRRPPPPRPRPRRRRFWMGLPARRRAVGGAARASLADIRASSKRSRAISSPTGARAAAHRRRRRRAPPASLRCPSFSSSAAHRAARTLRRSRARPFTAAGSGVGRRRCARGVACRHSRGSRQQQQQQQQQAQQRLGVALRSRNHGRRWPRAEASPPPPAAEEGAPPPRSAPIPITQFMVGGSAPSPGAHGRRGAARRRRSGGRRRRRRRRQFRAAPRSVDAGSD